MALKLVREQLTLVYGMRLFTGSAADAGPHAYVAVTAPDGHAEEMALHTISGSRDEIRAQLLDSIDAFFELVDPSAPSSPSSPSAPATPLGPTTPGEDR